MNGTVNFRKTADDVGTQLGEHSARIYVVK